MTICLIYVIVTAFALSFPDQSTAADIQFPSGYIPRNIAKLNLQPIGSLPASMRLQLAIGLPLRNREALANLLQQIYDPRSVHYHHYLTPAQFTEMFGPTEEDYQALISFAQSNGLSVNGTHPNRILLDVNGSVADVESAFHVKMREYRHPTENRAFYAPDAEPTLKLRLPVSHIDGLDNYIVPHPVSLRATPFNKTCTNLPDGGTGQFGTFLGTDLRNAYAPGVSLTGIGQSGLLEFDGYYSNDIIAYEISNGLQGVFVTNVPVAGFDGTPGTNSDSVAEVSLDLEMAMAMAPGATIIVYEGSSTNSADLLNRMATDDLAKQLSSSWTVGLGPTQLQICQEFALQGQAFFQASGDEGALPTDESVVDGNITYVGGTTLTTDPSGAWASETAWHPSSFYSSGGGISTDEPIPVWQQGLDMSANHGSTFGRNFPDVAIVAANVWYVYDNGLTGGASGTSVAAPLWAGFAALVNQQAEANGYSAVGCLNPSVYAIGRGQQYGSAFHDITTGNNTNSVSPANYFAVPGYDLCTGWGTPNGSALINLLASPSSLGVAPQLTIVQSGSNVILAWPANATAFTLVSATNLGFPAAWSSVAPAPVLVNMSNIVVNTMSSNQRFYQLAERAMALIPSGSFTMGDTLDGESDATPTNVTVSGFYMDTKLISYSEWVSVYIWAARKGYAFVNAGLGVDGDHPVYSVDWYDTIKWSNARSQQEGFTPVYYTDAGLTQLYTNGETAPYVNWAANGYRLPTEAEWEKAARGGLSGQRFPWGNMISESLANYYGDTADFGYDLGPDGPNAAFTYGLYFFSMSPVGYFAANGFGLFDMAGNVTEWCWDWYGAPYGQPSTNNPTGPETGTDRVLRGGDWQSTANWARCASRDFKSPSAVGGGFRCVRGH
jgi:subtilase family serine protease